MKFLIVKTNGNGYFCGCCRRTSTDTDEIEFETNEEAIEYARKYNSENDVDRDSIIDYVYPIGDCIYES